MLRPVLAAILLTLVASCAKYTLVDTERTTVGDTFTLDPQIAWSRTREGQIEWWTVDGLPLDALVFVTGLEDGQPLFVTAGESPPAFKAHGTPGEIVEFVVDSMVAVGWVAVESSALAPARLGPHPGYRFTVECTTARGLAQRGFGIGSVVDDRLYLVMYVAAEDYYYDYYRPYVEKMIESINM